MMVDLTLEEQHELDERPVNPDSACIFTAEQFKMRQQIGEKITKLIYEDAVKSIDTDLAAMYLKYPPYRFYISKDGGSCRRIYGVSTDSDGKFVAQAVTAMMMFNNDVIGGVPFEEMKMLDNWGAEKESFLRSGLVQGPGIFLDPLGFLLLAR